jgi:DNA invertase Pin-like site-specific DNA recombinase
VKELPPVAGDRYEPQHPPVGRPGRRGPRLRCGRTARSRPALPVPDPIAFSYQRFSKPEQARGDSIRRQDTDALAWCERNKVPLDASLTLRDRGVSAWTGGNRKDPERHALALFLKWIENGRVRPGDYLVIENLDRLSRENEVPATHLLLSILVAGVRVVQLLPAELILTEKSDAFDVMRAVMELSRGHGESQVKSERVGKAWAQKRKGARAGGKAHRDGGKVVTRRLPAWVELVDGELRLIPGRAATLRRIYHLAGSGYGHHAILRLFQEEGVAPFGAAVVRSGRKRSQFAGRWTAPYIAKLLRDRRVVGEYQPCGKGRKPDGDPIPHYFPAAVSEEEWQRARAGAAERRHRPGRIGRYVNVFAKLLRDARDGSSYTAKTRTVGGRLRRVLLNAGSVEGRAAAASFPFDSFEQAVLSLLREVDPKTVLGEDDGPDEVRLLQAELGETRGVVRKLEAELLKGDVAALARVLRQQEARERDLVEKLRAAQQRAAHPLSAAWDEARPLLGALDGAPDPRDARLRLRSALRQVVESIWLLVVPRGRDRLCVVQIRFAGGASRRDYLIIHRPPKANGSARAEGGWWACSLANADVAALGQADLRDRDSALRLEADLGRLDAERLWDQLGAGPEARGPDEAP